MSPSRILNQIGLFAQFVALWLVTPGIIGEKRMLEAGEKLAKAADRLRKPIVSFAGNCLFCGCLGLFLFVVSGAGGIYVLTSEQNWNWRLVLEIIGGVMAVIIGVPVVMLILSAPIAGLSWLTKKTIKSEKTLLVAGAYCFTIGFSLLFAATWFSP